MNPRALISFRDLSLDDWRNLAAIGASVFAIVLGMWRFIRARQPQIQLAVHEEETRLIDNLREAIPNFEASYGNEIINDMSVSQFFIWNSGTEAMRRENIAPLNPIRIEFPASVRILECAILRRTSPSINFDASIRDQRIVDVSFDYLNKQDGALVQVLFTGSAGTETDVHGQLIGPRPKIEYTGDESYRVHGYNKAGIILGSWVKTVSIVGNFAFGLLLIASYAFRWSIVSLVLGLLFAVVAVWSWVPSKNKIPKALRQDPVPTPTSSS